MYRLAILDAAAELGLGAEERERALLVLFSEELEEDSELLREYVSTLGLNEDL